MDPPSPGALSRARDSSRRWDLRSRPQDRPGEGALARMALPVKLLDMRRPAASLQPQTNALRVRCEIVNRSSESWREEAGWAVGYQLFDEPTSTLVVDGERKPLRLAPSESREIEMEIALPPE